MILPFRMSMIFRNRWVALMWAAGVCFTAAQIVDTVAGSGNSSGAAPVAADESDPVAVALGNAPLPASTMTEHAR